MSSIVVASAGSGKTTWIVDEVVSDPSRTCLVTTFTRANAESLMSRICERAGGPPPNVTLQPWLTFMLRDAARPYQNYCQTRRIPTINFVTRRSTRGIKKTSARFYFDGEGRIYTDKLSQFALECNAASGGLVMARLKRLYSRIFVDEAQDLAGYDLDLVQEMMKAGLEVHLVGDGRQTTYSTNPSGRHSGFRGEKILGMFQKWHRKGLCELVTHNHSYRCGPEICRVADLLFPEYPKTESLAELKGAHQGVFLVDPKRVHEYALRFSPQALRHSTANKCQGLDGMNFGYAKGLEFEHVMIFPTGPIRKWLETGQRERVEKGAAKAYVAITRASHSVAFVHAGTTALAGIERWPAQP